MERSAGILFQVWVKLRIFVVHHNTTTTTTTILLLLLAYCAVFLLRFVLIIGRRTNDKTKQYTHTIFIFKLNISFLINCASTVLGDF